MYPGKAKKYFAFPFLLERSENLESKKSLGGFMKKLICAVMACFFISTGFLNMAAAADPAPTGAYKDKGIPTNNGWTGK